MKTHPQMALLATLLDDVKTTAELVNRVVAKYPYTSLPPQLQPFAFTTADISVRFSSVDPDMLRLQLKAGFSSRSASMPATWVGAPQSEVTKAVRRMYKDHQESARKQHLDRLRRQIEANEESLVRKTAELVKNRAEYANLNGNVQPLAATA